MRPREWIQKLWHRAKRGQPDEEADDVPTDSPTAIGIITHDVIVGSIKHFIARPRRQNDWPWELYMLFLPGTDHLSEDSYNRGLEWKATLAVRTKDLRALMERGIRLRMKTHEARTRDIDVERIPRDEVSYSRTLRLLIRRRQWKFPGPGPRSQGHMLLSVSTRGVKEAYEFDPRQLSARNVVAAVAFDAEGKTVYKFSELDPQDNFNTIYGDEPMEGLWPWPRATEEGQVST